MNRIDLAMMLMDLIFLCPKEKYENYKACLSLESHSFVEIAFGHQSNTDKFEIRHL